MALPNEPLSRTEQYLNRIATGGGTIPEEPYTRIEMYLNKIATGSGEVPEKALTRVEMYLDEIAKNGGGGSDITLETLTVEQNGTTAAPDGTAYNKVVANVPNTYAASDNGKVVSGGSLVAQTEHAEVTQNGTIDTTTNNTVTVNVPKKETLSWHQCPEAVRNYLAAALAAYPTNGGATIVDQYAPNYINIEPDVSRANSKPIGYTVDGVTFYDNEPLIAEPFSTASKAGTLTALDWLRWYNTTLAAPATGSNYKRGYNCRDLGGWACDGGTIKYGMLVRGSEPNSVDRDLMVGKIGIKTEVQLLPLSEQATDYQMKSAWGIDWAGNDTENVKVYSPADASDPAKKALWAKILKAIIDSVNHDKPVYFHCGVGADRTGVTAMVLEGILGVSSDNVDIDFELTNFALGWHYLESGDVYRGREYTEYIKLKQAFTAIPLVGGLSDTFRNHCVSFALSLGITIDEINAFRSAMIDGTPEVITPTLTTYTITRNGENVTFSNQTASVRENESYSVTVTANIGYKIDGVVVTMGGVDVSNCYSDGVVSIPSVTGNVVITASSSVKPITNLADPTSAEWKSGYRINGSGSIVTGQSQVTNLIPVSVGDIIRIKNAGSSATMLYSAFPNAESTTGTPLTVTPSYDSANDIATFTITSAAYPYARWSIPNSQIADVNTIIITRNEEINS